MPLIDTTTTRAVANIKMAGLEVPPDLLAKLVDLVRKNFSGDAWTFYRAHSEDVLTTIRIQKKVLWFNININYDVKVKDARWLVEQFAGPEPAMSKIAEL